MKNGKMVAKSLDTKNVDDNELIELMMGEIKTSIFEKNNAKGPVKLETKNISLSNDDGQVLLNDISLPNRFRHIFVRRY